MCSEFGSWKRVADWWLMDEYELIDVDLRIYVLCNAIEKAIAELERAAE